MVISAAGTITNNRYRRFYMISVEIDISKGKSTVCVLDPYAEIMCKGMKVMLKPMRSLSFWDADTVTI